MSDFPNRLKKLRSDRKPTRQQLAEKLSVSQNAVYNLENGKQEPKKLLPDYTEAPVF